MPAIPAIIASVASAASSAGAAIAGGASAAASAIGVPASIAGGIGSAAEGAAAGSGLGALEAAATGKPIGQGAEFGAITGGALGGLSGPLQGLTGLGPTATDALIGAGSGALAGQLTGAGALQGAIGGGISGAVTGAFGGGAKGGGGAAPSSSLATSSSFDLGPDPLASTPVDGSLSIEGSPASGSLTAPVQSTLPGSVGAGAAAGGGSNVTSIEGVPVNEPLTGSLTGSTPSLSATAPSAAAAAAPASAAGGSSFGKFFSNPMNDLTIGALGLSALKGQQQPAFEKQLAAEASQASRQGQQLKDYALSGTLPPGLQESLTGATDAAKAATNNFYATHGMAGSSAAAEDLGNLQMREQAQAAQIAQQLFQSGVSESQLSSNIYSELVNMQIQQDSEFSSAVGNLAAAFARSAMPVAAAA